MTTPLRTIVAGSAGDPLAEAVALTRRLKLPHIRRALGDLIPTAKAQRWDPAEVVRVLLAEEAAGRDAATYEPAANAPRSPPARPSPTGTNKRPRSHDPPKTRSRPWNG